MKTARDLLRTKGDQVWSVPLQATVLETLKMLADKDVGALVVMDGEKIAGIISERDFVRSIAQTEQCLLGTLVRNYMTREVVTVGLDHSLDECMQVMTHHRVRHLPVMDQDRLVGLVSIGDVVKAIITSSAETINSLENYIEGRGFGH